MIDPLIAAIRLGLALVCGAVAGVEREWRHKNAGIKTNTLVSIGSAIFALMSDTFGPGNHNPGQLAAAVVGGIGFIGAGVILRRGSSVQGVTTAATLWVSAAMGMAMGLGQYAIGSIGLFSILVVQFGMRYAVKAIARRSAGAHEIELRIECTGSALTAVHTAWREFVRPNVIADLRHSTARVSDHFVWRAIFTVNERNTLDLTTLEERLAIVPGVTKIEMRLASASDEPF